MKSARPLLIGLLVLVGAAPLLCGGAIALTLVLNAVGVIPDDALEPDPRTPTVPKLTATPPLFQADPLPKRQSGDSWTLRVLSAQRLPTVDDLPAPAGQVWLVVKIRATMTDTLYKKSSRTLYNRAVRWSGRRRRRRWLRGIRARIFHQYLRPPSGHQPDVSGIARSHGALRRPT
jgi:hypothetical protein